MKLRLLWTAAATQILLVALCCPTSSSAFERSLSEWKRDLFSEKDGGLYVTVAFDGFRSASMQSLEPDRLTVRVRNLLSSEIMSWTQSTRGVTPIKIPAGKYELLSVAFTDGAGSQRSWTPKNAGSTRPFVVAKQSLSNLGLWTFSPEGSGSLRLHYTATNASPSLVPAERKAIRAIINGFKGQVQEQVAGQKTEVASSFRVRGDQLEMTVRGTREISLQRQVSSRGASAQEIQNTLRGSDPVIRECYKKKLAEDSSARGRMELAFILSRETKSIKKLTLSGGDFQDQPFVVCVVSELNALKFEVSASAIGKIVYEFDSRT